MTAEAHAPGLDRPVLGMGLMLGFCLLAPMGDALGKVLAEHHAVMQIVLCRFAVQTAVLIPLVIATGRSFAMSPLGWRLTVLRTLLHVMGLWLMVTALTWLPLADAIAIAFVMPFILLLLGHVLLGETVGRRRLTACGVGFCGTLMVMQPSFAAVGWPALYPLGVAFAFAGFMLVTRRIAGEADPLAMQGVSGAMAAGGLALLYLVLPPEGLFALTPIGADWTLWLTMGLLGTGAHLLMTWSLRFAQAATLAPMQYLEIPIAAVIGLLVFGDWPNALAGAGIAVTVATGLYILWRENADQGRRA